MQLAAVAALMAERAGDRGDVRDAAAYRTLRDAVRPRLEDTVHRVITDLVAVLGAAREVDAAVRSSTSVTRFVSPPMPSRGEFSTTRSTPFSRSFLVISATGYCAWATAIP